MKHLKKFESIKSLSDVESEIKYKYITYFDSMKSRNEFMLATNKYKAYDYDPDDFILEFDLEKLYPDVSKDELIDIIIDLVNKIDLDSNDSNEIRNGSHSDYLIKKTANKYNL